MSQDTIDLLKVMVVAFVLFAAGALALFFVSAALREYGGSLPVIGNLRAYDPPSAIPVIVDMRWVVVVGATFLTASGLALAAWSATLDMALLVFAKAVTVLIAAAFGIFAGTWGYMRLTQGSELSLMSLNRLAIALVAFFVFSTLLRNANLRGTSPMRFVAAIVLVVLGPILLAST
jgi:hypothetical protein